MTISQAPVSRRGLLRWGLAVGAASPLLSACGGFGSAGGSKGLVMLSTQFAAVEEAARFRTILKNAYHGAVDFVTMATPADFAAKVKAEVGAGKPSMNLLGGLHSDFVPFAHDGLEDLSSLAGRLAGRGYSTDLLTLAKLGTDKPLYIPWAQATYVLMVNKTALQWLPSGADVENLTYDQLLAWAKAAKSANKGKAVFGVPAGPLGLLHRFMQGFLLPSFTGGMVTTWRSPQAVQAWEWFKEFWNACNPASTNYNYMQDPLASKQVLVAWDHVARLVDAPKSAPDQFTAVQVPAGPKGRGYMGVVSGLAIPKGAKKRQEAEKLIEALSDPKVQLEVLRQNVFFPTVKAQIPSDLPPAVRLEAAAVTKQEGSPNAILALPPVGLGTKEGEMTQVFHNMFDRCVKGNEPIPKVLDEQARALQQVLDEAKVPCWAPDPSSNGQPCKVA
jgi:multiple sugar transport system substrate-binding protein